MEAITASNFRNSLASFLDKVTNDHEPMIVTRGDKQKSAVVMSKEDYESLQETLYLLSSRANADRLFSAFTKIDSGVVMEKELANETDKGDVDT